MARRFDPVSLGSPTFTQVEVGGLQITRAHFPAGLLLPRHRHERATVATTIAGAWSSSLGARRHECREATLLVEPAEESHSNHFAIASDVLVVQPDPSRAELLQPCARLLEEGQSFASVVVRSLAERLAAELSSRDVAARLVLEGLALELLATALRNGLPTTSHRRPAWVTRVRERIRDGNIAGASISDIAADVSVHPVHLARVFRAHFGMSPGAYARQVRLQRTAERLARGDESVAAIAQEAGFADQSHFTRAFRRHTGMTPAAFRRQTRR